jgi:hypothetical protein
VLVRLCRVVICADALGSCRSAISTDRSSLRACTRTSSGMENLIWQPCHTPWTTPSWPCERAVSLRADGRPTSTSKLDEAMLSEGKEIVIPKICTRAVCTRRCLNILCSRSATRGRRSRSRREGIHVGDVRSDPALRPRERRDALNRAVLERGLALGAQCYLRVCKLRLTRAQCATSRASPPASRHCIPRGRATPRPCHPPPLVRR